MIPQAISKILAMLAAFMPLPEQVAAFALGLTVGLLIARRLDARQASKAAESIGKAVKKLTPNRVPKKR
jgi:hypothetical protein